MDTHLSPANLNENNSILPTPNLHATVEQLMKLATSSTHSNNNDNHYDSHANGNADSPFNLTKLNHAINLIQANNNNNSNNIDNLAVNSFNEENKNKIIQSQIDDSKFRKNSIIHTHLNGGTNFVSNVNGLGSVGGGMGGTFSPQMLAGLAPQNPPLSIQKKPNQLSVWYECSIINMMYCILSSSGPMTIGRLGTLLHHAMNNHQLPQILKKQFGGLQKFVKRHTDKFILSVDHPFNPTVYLSVVYSSPFPYGLFEPNKALTPKNGDDPQKSPSNESSKDKDPNSPESNPDQDPELESEVVIIPIHPPVQTNNMNNQLRNHFAPNNNSNNNNIPINNQNGPLHQNNNMPHSNYQNNSAQRNNNYMNHNHGNNNNNNHNSHRFNFNQHHNQNNHNNHNQHNYNNHNHHSHNQSNFQFDNHSHNQNYNNNNHHHHNNNNHNHSNKYMNRMNNSNGYHSNSSDPVESHNFASNNQNRHQPSYQHSQSFQSNQTQASHAFNVNNFNYANTGQQHHSISPNNNNYYNNRQQPYHHPENLYNENPAILQNNGHNNIPSPLHYNQNFPGKRGQMYQPNNQTPSNNNHYNGHNPGINNTNNHISGMKNNISNGNNEFSQYLNGAKPSETLNHSHSQYSNNFPTASNPTNINNNQYNNNHNQYMNLNINKNNYGVDIHSLSDIQDSITLKSNNINISNNNNDNKVTHGGPTSNSNILSDFPSGLENPLSNSAVVGVLLPPSVLLPKNNNVTTSIYNSQQGPENKLTINIATITDNQESITATSTSNELNAQNVSEGQGQSLKVNQHAHSASIDSDSPNIPPGPRKSTSSNNEPSPRNNSLNVHVSHGRHVSSPPSGVSDSPLGPIATPLFIQRVLTDDSPQSQSPYVNSPINSPSSSGGANGNRLRARRQREPSLYPNVLLSPKSANNNSDFNYHRNSGKWNNPKKNQGSSSRMSFSSGFLQPQSVLYSSYYTSPPQSSLTLANSGPGPSPTSSPSPSGPSSGPMIQTVNLPSNSLMQVLTSPYNSSNGTFNFNSPSINGNIMVPVSSGPMLVLPEAVIAHQLNPGGNSYMNNPMVFNQANQLNPLSTQMTQSFY